MKKTDRDRRVAPTDSMLLHSHGKLFGRRRRSKSSVTGVGKELNGREIAYKFGRAGFRFVLPRGQLTPAELRTLIAIIYLCDKRRDQTIKDGASIKVAGDRAGQSTLTITTSLRELDRLSNGTQTKKTSRVKERLERLAEITIHENVEALGFHASYPLLSFNDRNGETYVTLNPRATAVILGAGAISWLRLDHLNRLSERAQLVYAFLASWCGPGHLSKIGVDTLASNALGSESQPRRRRMHTLAAIKEINEIDGWGITTEEGGKSCTVTRSREV